MKKPTIFAMSLAATILGTQAIAAPIGALGVYTFEDGTASDSSGNGNDGTVLGGVTFTGPGTGHDGGSAASFTPLVGLSGIRVPIDINSAALPAMSMGAWVNAAPDAGNIGKVLSHDNGNFDRTIGLDFRSDDGQAGVNYAAFTGSGVLDAPGIFASVWTHIAVTYTGSATSLYINGILADTGIETASAGWTDMFIGTNPSFNEDFKGLVDDAFVYGRALSANEIGDIYQNGFGDVSVVPLPAGLPMLLASLGLMAGLRRRKN